MVNKTTQYSTQPGTIPIVADSTLDERTLAEWAFQIKESQSFLEQLQQDGGTELIGSNNGLSLKNKLDNLPKTRVSIQHYRNSIYIYDVIRVTGGLHSIVKKYGDDVDASGVQTRLSPKQLAKQKGYVAAINADFFSAPDGGSFTTSEQAKCWGLQIVDGVAYRDWDANAIDVALVMMSDGSIEIARKSDGKTAQQWVDEGAVWSVSARGLAVENGATNDISSYPGNDIKSARNIFGIDSNGDFIFVLVEGVSGSYGATANEAGQIALDHGAVLAASLDGGGSTQCWWDDCYALPSTDSSPRAVCGCLMINAPGIPTYDSGSVQVVTNSNVTGPNLSGHNAIELRQTGSQVRIKFNCNTTTMPQDTFTQIVDSVRLRYLPINDRQMKGFVDTGAFGKVSINTTSAAVSVLPYTSAGSRVLGSMTWESRFSDE